MKKFRDISENTVYTTPSEKMELLKNKERVAEYFSLNFFGMLGLLNGLPVQQRSNVLKFLKADKQLQINNIGDSNLDISLSLKLAYDVGFFNGSSIVNEITRFLVKLRAGQIDVVDSVIVAKWANSMKSDFLTNIKDSTLKKSFIDFQKGKGLTVDVSHIAFNIRKKISFFDDGGDFSRYLKLYSNIVTELILNQTPINIPIVSNTDSVRSKVVEPIGSVTILRKPDQNFKLTTSEFSEFVKCKSKTLDDTRKDVRLFFENKFNEIPNEDSLKVIDKVSSALYDVFRVHTNSKFYDELVVGLSLLEYVEDQLDILRNELNVPYSYPSYLDDYFQLHYTTTLNLNSKMSLIIANAHIQHGEFKPKWLTVGNSVDNEIVENLVTVIPRHLSSARNYKRFKDEAAQVISDFSATGKGIWRSSNNVITPFSYIMSFIVDDSALDDYFRKSVDFVVDIIRRDKFRFMVYLEQMIDKNISNLTFFPNFMDGLFKGDLSSDNSLYMKKLAEELMPKKNIIWLLQYYSTYKIPISAYKNTPVFDGILKKMIEDELLNSANIISYFSTFSLNNAVTELGIDLKQMSKENPDNHSISSLFVKLNGFDPSVFSPSDISKYIEGELLYNFPDAKKSDITSRIKMINVNRLVGTIGGEPSNNIKVLSEFLMDEIETNKDNDWQNVSELGKFLVKNVIHMDKNTIISWMKLGEKTGNPFIFTDYLYKTADNKQEKERYLTSLRIILLNTEGAGLEDFIESIINNLPGSAVKKISAEISGMASLIEELSSSDIQPFDSLTDERVTSMLYYNDLDFDVILKDNTIRKNRGEKFVDFFNRAKREVKEKGLLSPLQIAENKDSNIKLINTLMIERDYAGKHGNIYPSIKRVFDVNMSHDEFDSFRSLAIGDGTVIPAYHGTGGIAAGMILRYGFTVVKSSDESVTGRMLGDGIYFSNKIDKTLQYIGNSGYSRTIGERGYIFEMDVELGVKKKDYDSAGLGGDSIASPEWCVYDPKKQTHIIKAYEVELVDKDTIMKLLAEETTHKGFGDFITESVKGLNQICYVFRDGNIPVPNKQGKVTYVDFELALSKKLISKGMFDKSAQGPMIVFRDTIRQEIFDYRYAEDLQGRYLHEYVELFKKGMKGK